MLTREIDTQEWKTFFDQFSKHHPGTTATVQIIGEDLGAQEEVKELPFVGASFEPKGSARGSILILMGKEPDEFVEHLIEHPTRVWLRTGGDGESDAIAIETADHITTILQLQLMPALPKAAEDEKQDGRNSTWH